MILKHVHDYSWQHTGMKKENFSRITRLDKYDFAGQEKTTYCLGYSFALRRNNNIEVNIHKAGTVTANMI